MFINKKTGFKYIGYSTLDEVIAASMEASIYALLVSQKNKRNDLIAVDNDSTIINTVCHILTQLSDILAF